MSSRCLSFPQLVFRMILPLTISLDFSMTVVGNMCRYDAMFNRGGKFAGGENMMKFDWVSGYAKIMGVADLSVTPEMTDAQMWRKAGAMSAKEASRRGKAPKLSVAELEKTKKKNIFGF